MIASRIARRLRHTEGINEPNVTNTPSNRFDGLSQEDPGDIPSTRQVVSEKESSSASVANGQRVGNKKQRTEKGLRDVVVTKAKDNPKNGDTKNRVRCRIWPQIQPQPKPVK